MTDLIISSPCAADWNAMTPAAAGRHCAECGKDVVDLTCLSPTARTIALKRLERAVVSGRRVCVRSPVDAHGRLISHPSRSHDLRRQVLTGGMAALLAMAMTGCQGEGPVTHSEPAPPQPPQHQKMGKVAATLHGEAEITPHIKPEVKPEVKPQPMIMGDVGVVENPKDQPVLMGRAVHPVMMGIMAVDQPPAVEPQPKPPAPNDK